MQPAGLTFLRDNFDLDNIPLRHESSIGSVARTIETNRDGVRHVQRTFQRAYDPGPDPLDHVVFSLKYEPLNLVLLREVFLRMHGQEVVEYIFMQPTSAYARRIGFLYEFLTGETLPMADGIIGGNYQPLLDPAKLVTATTVRKVPRWRIDDNLLGTPAFTPIIERTAAVDAVIATDWAAQIRDVLASQPQEAVHRALAYLYLKETRSSFLLEGETPGREREERFVAFLRTAGRLSTAEALCEPHMVQAQRAILDSRYAQPAYRANQNYVGSRSRGIGEVIHFIPPPPELVRPLMDGLAASAAHMDEAPPAIQAAVVGFQFVFIHPFEDGNGRLHRFLLHDVLTRRGLLPFGAALPLSAAMVADRLAYDRSLEAFSRPLMAAIRYAQDYQGRVTVTNPQEVEAFYRFPDLTQQVEYFGTVLRQAIADLPREVNYLQLFDRAFTAAQAVVDMPDLRLRTILAHIDDGGGVLSNNKRKQFKELTDEEVAGIVAAYAGAFSAESDEVPSLARVPLPELPRQKGTDSGARPIHR